MRKNPAPIFVSNDQGLLKHWRNALEIQSPIELDSFAALHKTTKHVNDIVWLDLQVSDIPPWNDIRWADLLRRKAVRIVATSSRPNDDEAIRALDEGCAGYCHAYSDRDTLLQVNQVIQAGHVWIGQQLMQQLIQTANRVAPFASKESNAWDTDLTTREREVAKMAAHGASNLVIAEQCDITERTVKAHLSAAFGKLGVTDRLQLALRVHGIQ